MSNAAPVQRTNGLAIAALVTSFFIGVLGIILGFIAMNQIKKSGEGGRGMALAGVIIGFVSVGFWIIYIIVFAVIFSSAMVYTTTY